MKSSTTSSVNAGSALNTVKNAMKESRFQFCRRHSSKGGSCDQLQLMWVCRAALLAAAQCGVVLLLLKSQARPMQSIPCYPPLQHDLSTGPRPPGNHHQPSCTMHNTHIHIEEDGEDEAHKVCNDVEAGDEAHEDGHSHEQCDELYAEACECCTAHPSHPACNVHPMQQAARMTGMQLYVRQVHMRPACAPLCMLRKSCMYMCLGCPGCRADCRITMLNLRAGAATPVHSCVTVCPQPRCTSYCLTEIAHPLHGRTCCQMLPVKSWVACAYHAYHACHAMVQPTFAERC